MPGINAIEGGRWDNFLRRFFNIKERGVAPSLAPEIVPIIGVEPNDDPTAYFLRSARLMAGSMDIAAVAAEFGIWELRNPVGSNTLVTVTQTWFTGRSNIVTLLFGVSVQLSSAEANITTKGLRDLRWDDGAGGQIQQSAAAFLEYNDPAIPGVLIKEFNGGATGQTHFEWNVPIVIPPGYSVFGTNRNVNERFIGGVVWWERPLEPSEL